MSVESGILILPGLRPHRIVGMGVEHGCDLDFADLVFQGTALLLGHFKVITDIYDDPRLGRLDGDDVPDPPPANAVNAVCNFPHIFFFHLS